MKRRVFLLLGWLLLTTPVAVQAQFNYMTSGGTTTITGYTGSGGAVAIPGTINGLPVIGIGNQAFHGCTSLTGADLASFHASL